ncbi:response regulator transcription factor [Pelagicoccus sp. SDUM812005]|uniref:response regulator transcription factor n=1 Tax=Pelagicoccus sp. SDUM812005 TaxID=3041257 RepID=UPI00280D7424|nr:response regulator transcription factor [Pelagicoccus sp. SDUM812005]MDQ8179323.1 response regulator transcription factor [Pelagicoccus sp. SDUM812005]
MSERIRIVLVDDQALFLEGLRTLLSLEPSLEIVGECLNGQEALEACRRLKPSIVLMDLNMPVLDGVAATKAIKAEMPEVNVLTLTTFDDDERVFEALKAGSSGYLLKDTPSRQLVEAIRAVSAGESFLQPSIASKVLAEFSRMSSPAKAAERKPVKLLEPLSAREEEVLVWLSRGCSNKEIAGRLSLAEGTVKNHVSNVLGKLGVLDRTQAALMARDLGLV